jgi:transposase InsO family protein
VTVFPFVAAEKVAGQKVAKACALLAVSRSAYYQWSEQKESKRTRSDRELSGRITEIHKQSRGTYGAPRVHEQLRQDGVRCSKKRVARLMGLEGLAGRAKRRFKRTTVADPEAEAKNPDLVKRRFAPGDLPLDHTWVSDITYVRTWEGWCYLATIIDLASRRVVGFAMADHMKASLVCEALQMALSQRRPAPGLIFHSDRGSQYTSKKFRKLLAKRGIRQSLSRPGQCWDNAAAESFFSTLKVELVYRRSLPTRAAACLALFEYIEVFYNRQRLHSSIGYRNPVAFEKIITAAATGAAPAA